MMHWNLLFGLATFVGAVVAVLMVIWITDDAPAPWEDNHV